jgi:hypothetical protein
MQTHRCLRFGLGDYATAGHFPEHETSEHRISTSRSLYTISILLSFLSVAIRRFVPQFVIIYQFFICFLPLLASFRCKVFVIKTFIFIYLS